MVLSGTFPSADLRDGLRLLCCLRQRLTDLWGFFPHCSHEQRKNAALRKWLHGSQSETLQKQLVIVLVPHFKTKIGFVWSINSGRMWYISLCILIVLSSSNSSFIIAGNYFLRKAHLFCTWKASYILLQEQVLLWYSVKQLEGETFIKFGSWLPAEEPLSHHRDRQLSHLQEIMGTIFHCIPWSLYSKHRAGILLLSGLN